MGLVTFDLILCRFVFSFVSFVVALTYLSKLGLVVIFVILVLGSL